MASKLKKLTSNQSGIAGEYFVAAELSRRGFTASLTLKNTKGVDILVSDAKAKTFIGIQVKTKQDARKVWLLSKKNETFSVDNLFYVFVDFKCGDGIPAYHIVPSNEVAKSIKAAYKKWRSSLGKKGQIHNDVDMREYTIAEGTWQDWNILQTGRLGKCTKTKASAS
jgi:hypothetical protein